MKNDITKKLDKVRVSYKKRLSYLFICFFLYVEKMKEKLTMTLFVLSVYLPLMFCNRIEDFF